MSTDLKRPLCIYYITGHGFGHATRAIGLVEKLLESGFAVEIVSALQQDFFLGTISVDSSQLSTLTVSTRSLDAGAIQLDPLRMDVTQTLRNYFENIHLNYSTLLDQEVQFLSDRKPDIVLVDATPIACTAAKTCNIVSVIVSNFTWDSIYRAMLESSVVMDTGDISRDELDEMVTLCSEDYCNAEYYIQLPGMMPVPNNFQGQVIPAPLVGRQAVTPRDVVRGKYGIPSSAIVVLFGFGGHSMSDLSLSSMLLPQDWICLVLQGEGVQMPSEHFIPLSRNIFVPDILAASDVMLGKLGYGTVSECLSSKTPLVYVQRDGWPEELPLKELMEKYNALVHMPKNDFFSGNWSTYLVEAYQKRDHILDLHDLQFENAFEAVSDIVQSIVF
jgi:L-arabinokinase